jgi:indole-3-glycerol phosphate synthase
MNTEEITNTVRRLQKLGGNNARRLQTLEVDYKHWKEITEHWKEIMNIIRRFQTL